MPHTILQNMPTAHVANPTSPFGGMRSVISSPVTSRHVTVGFVPGGPNIKPPVIGTPYRKPTAGTPDPGGTPPPTTVTSGGPTGPIDPYAVLQSLFGPGSTTSAGQAIVGLPIQQNTDTGAPTPNYKLIGIVAVAGGAVVFWLYKSGKLKL